MPWLCARRQQGAGQSHVPSMASNRQHPAPASRSCFVFLFSRGPVSALHHSRVKKWRLYSPCSLNSHAPLYTPPWPLLLLGRQQGEPLASVTGQVRRSRVPAMVAGPSPEPMQRSWAGSHRKPCGWSRVGAEEQEQVSDPQAGRAPEGVKACLDSREGAWWQQGGAVPPHLCQSPHGDAPRLQTTCSAPFRLTLF